MNNNIFSIIDDVSSKHCVDSKAIKAICVLESGMNLWVVRYEPDYIWTYRPDYYAEKNNISLNTEMYLQKMSYGLMQIMGGLARSPYSFKDHLSKLLIPRLNLEIGIKHFKSLLEKYDWNYLDAVSAYNLGSVKKIRGKYTNAGYVGKYKSILETLNISESEF